METIENIVGGMYLCLVTPVIISMLCIGKLLSLKQE